MNKISFPTAHSVLLIIAALVAFATWFLPSGKFNELKHDKEKNQFVLIKSDAEVQLPASQKTLDSLGIKINVEKFVDGSIWKPVSVPGTFYQTESKPQGIVEFLKSPIQGMTEAIDVILFVLIIGGFIGIVNSSGAFDAGVNKLANSLKGREKLLIIIITTLIAFGGTTFGLAEETIAFYPILVPVFLAARYDAMVALASIYIGSSIGTMVSTVNPFSAIIASNAAGINWTSGLYGRIIMLILGTILCLWYIINYAEKVRKDSSKSLIFSQKEEIEALFLSKKSENLTFNWRISLVLFLFAASFIMMIIGVSVLKWWFMEMTILFLVASVLIGIVIGISEKKFVEQFVKGANDLLNVALIIGIARGITWLMDQGAVSATILNASSSVVEGMNKGIFINLMMFIYAGLSFFIPSSSGLAVMSMPIMAPLADVVDVPRELLVNAYQYGMGLMAFITPTGLILASLTMVNVGYNVWLKFVLPLLFWLTLLTMAVLTVQVYFF